MSRTTLRLGTLLTLTAASALVLAASGGGAPALVPAQKLGHGASLNGAEIVPGQVIVRYAAGTTRAARRSTLRAQGAAVARSLALPRTQLVELPDGTSVDEAIAAFEDDPDVAFAEPNYVYHLSATPNDTLFAQLWGLNQVSDKDIDAPEAWDITTGSHSIIVAVIDSGVEYNHPDLAARIWTNNDPAGGGDQDGNGFVDDTRGWDFIQNDNTPLDLNDHGTHVAGTIGAQGNNALGVTGVNWDVSIMPVRAGDAAGSLPGQAIINSIVYACKNGADIVNGSFGGSGFSQSTLNAINSAACANTLFVFAAGNGGADGVSDNNDTTPQYPCNYNTNRIVCVAATNQSDVLASFSNFGDTSVDLAAPGVGIHSSVPTFANAMADGFEDTPTLFSTRWVATGTWGRELVSYNPPPNNNSASDSPTGNYAASTDTTLRTAAATSLVGRTGCVLEYWFNLETHQNDFFRIEAATNSAGPWTDVTGGWFGATGPVFQGDIVSMADFEGLSPFLRLRMTTNADGSVANGVRVEDIALRCVGTPSVLGDYVNLNGTSMATPHVAGVAALILAVHPTIKPIQVRSILLSTVDPVAGLNNIVATGGRLNAHSAVTAPVDLTKPNTTITAGPKAKTKSKTAKFKFKSSEAGSTFKCKLDKGAFVACSSAKTYKKLKTGKHTFQVIATDKMGNVDTTAAKKSWKVTK